MTDPRPLPPTTPSGSEGDRRVDGLLNEGLEAYFAGRFEDAIHLWTRVLFLDRQQASARAYIERARGAIAERQRRADEALQTIGVLLDEGRGAEARRRLVAVQTVIGEDERTAALRVRIERLERLSPDQPRIHAAPMPASRWWAALAGWANHRVRVSHVSGALAVVVLAVVALSPGARAWLGLSAPPAAPVPTSAVAALPVLTSGEVALVRARALFARGRLAEALAALDRVGTEQTERTDADTLRVESQRVLLAAADDRIRRGAR